jgi:hypothetical protein
LNKAFRKRPLFGPFKTHLRMVFGNEAQAFLQKKGVFLVGDRLEVFVQAYVAAKEHAMRVLERNARLDYTPDDKVAASYPKFDPPKSEQQFDDLWSKFCEAKMISAGTRKKWEPYFAGLLRRVGSRDVSRAAGVGGVAAVGFGGGAEAAGATPVLHCSTYAFSVTPRACMPALSARHSAGPQFLHVGFLCHSVPDLLLAGFLGVESPVVQSVEFPVSLAEGMPQFHFVLVFFQFYGFL